MKLLKTISILSVFLCSCAVASNEAENKELNELEPREFAFGDLSLLIPDTRHEDVISCGDVITEYVEKEYRCQEFQVDGKTFFEGVYRKVKGEVAEGGIFEDASEPNLILDTLYFNRIILNGKTYILAIEYDYHDTLSVLYQLSVADNKVSFDKLYSIMAPFDGVYQVPGGVIFSGYNYQAWMPWAMYFDGDTVQELEFLGEPDELKIVDEVIVERDAEGNMFIDGVSVEEIRKTFPAKKNSPKKRDDKKEETKETLRY